MNIMTDNVQNSSIFADSMSIDKNTLAMDALSELAKQFTEHTDIEKLLTNLLFTLSGQFSVNNAFVMILQEGDYTSKQFYYGIGKYKNNDLLESIDMNADIVEYFKKNNKPLTIDELDIQGKSTNIIYKLIEANVSIIGPLILNNKFLGLIALGERVTGRGFSVNDLEILKALVNSITPFVSNTFLFMENTNLNTWYLEILNSVKHGLFVFDKNFYLKSVNDSGFELLKSYKSKLKNKKSLYDVSMEFIFTEAIFSGWANKIKKAYISQKKKVLKNLKVTSGNLDKIYNVTINTIQHKTESESDLIITIDDVTHIVESEHRMFEMEKFADKGVMAASIAHELNNFLGLLLGGVELTTIHLIKENKDKITSSIEKLKENIIKMQRFTAGLMDYTKLSTTKSIGNINNVIEDVISFLTVQKRYSGIHIRTELLTELDEIEFDGDQIAQLLLNFSNNAADAIKESDVKNGQITIRTFQEPDFVYLSVKDNGPGIKEDVKNKLFKHQLTTKKSGHGYGLVTCGKILDNHNADVTIESIEGDGATFTIKFPKDKNLQEST